MALAGVVVLVASGEAAAAADPPGNNGTVKVDGVVFDDHPDNQPHVGCVFQIDFAGFDEGDLDASVTFRLVPPTGAASDILVDDVAIGEDSAGGATDQDASATYDLSAALAGVEPHSIQGIHLRLIVHAEGSQGADTKFKEYWVTGCGSTPSTTGSTTTTTDKPGHGTTTTTDKPGHGTTTTETSGGSTTTASIVPGGGPGTPASPGDVPVTPAGDTLPTTGSNAGTMVLAGVALALVGVGTAVAARRLRAGRMAS
jgi:LPXTG-motif cell wall-anchored protein